MAYVPTLIKSGRRSCVLSLVEDEGPGSGAVTYAAIADVLPGGCALKPLFTATYATADEAGLAFAKAGLTFTPLALAPGAGIPMTAAIAFALTSGFSAPSMYARIAIDHSLTK